MPELNQFAISRSLGSTVAAGERPQFGRLALLPLVAKVCRPTAPAVTPGCLDGRFDQEIVAAFTAVGQGKARDRLLADPALAQRFVLAAKRTGVDAPPALVKRRLLRLGKAGGRLPKTTEKQAQPSIDDHNAFAIEYAIVRIAHLYGATVDDILCEDSVGLEYQKIVEALAPGYTPFVYRLGALYLRKTRNLQGSKQKVLAELNPSAIERLWVDLGNVSQIRKDSLITGPGILDLEEGDRSLYVTKTNSLAELAATFLGRQIWDSIGNHFWHPDRQRIHLKILPQAGLAAQLSNWELRLIQSKEPVFNIKVDKDAA